MGLRRPRLFEPRRVIKVLVLLLALLCIFGQSHHRAPAHIVSVSDSSTATELVATIASTRRLSSSDISQPHLARAVCQEHGWDVFDRKPVPKPGTGSSKRKVYDLFVVNNELDWLEIHLNATYDFVDYFVIVEGRKTFSGLDRPMLVANNWDRLAPYHDKIIYRELEYPADFAPKLSWDYEQLQRNALFTQVFSNLVSLQAPTEGDVLLVSDVDEIVRPETLVVLRACNFPRRLTLRSKFYYYSFQFIHQDVDWPHPQVTSFQGLEKTILPNDLRYDGGNSDWGLLAPLRRWIDKDELWNAGWHCSSCFATVNELLWKMESLSHMVLNAPKYRNPERIVDRVSKGKDLWDRKGELYRKIDNNTDVPATLEGDKNRWQYLLDRQGKSAGFADYP